MDLTWFILHNATVAIRISGVAIEAVAGSQVIDNLALGILATCTWTGITALLIEAGAIRWTIRVHYALRTAALVGIAKVLGQALTRASTAAFLALGIDAAGTWVAGLQYLDRRLTNWTALREWISGEA